MTILATPNHMKPTTSPYSTSSSTVLVVDDDQSTRMAVCDILSLNDIETIEAHSSEDCLELYHKYHQRIDLVFLDQNLSSKLTGLQTASRLRKINPNVKVVLMSGYHQEELAGFDIGGHIVGYVYKPFTMRSLLTEVKRHLLTQ